MDSIGLPNSGSAQKAPVQGHDVGSSEKAQLDQVSRAMATIQDDDERMLARIGYRQVWFSLGED